MTKPTHIPVREVARMLGVSTAAVYDRVKRRKIPLRVIPPDTVPGIPSADVDRWIAERYERAQHLTGKA